MIVKVKEPLAAERKKLRRGQVLFTYLHLAPDLAQTEDLIASGATCIAYETVTAPHGRPAAADADVGGRGPHAPQVGAHALEKAQGGRGVLLGGVPGVPAADVVVLGGGVAGTNAARDRARHGRQRHRGRQVDPTRCGASTRSSAPACARSSRPATRSPSSCRRADLVIGAVLVPGAAAPKLITARCWCRR